MTLVTEKTAENGEEVVVNGEAETAAADGDKPNKADIIVITGKPENCEAAKAALLVSSFSSFKPFCFHLLAA